MWKKLPFSFLNLIFVLSKAFSALALAFVNPQDFYVAQFGRPLKIGWEGDGTVSRPSRRLCTLCTWGIRTRITIDEEETQERSRCCKKNERIKFERNLSISHPLHG